MALPCHDEDCFFIFLKFCMYLKLYHKTRDRRVKLFHVQSGVEIRFCLHCTIEQILGTYVYITQYHLDDFSVVAVNKIVNLLLWILSLVLQQAKYWLLHCRVSM